MTEGIRPPDSKSPAKQLISASVNPDKANRRQAEEPKSEKAAPQLRRLDDSVSNNKEARAAIQRLADEPAAQRSAAAVKEVESAMQAASRVSPQDVEEFARRLADRIGQEPRRAMDAHGSPPAERVQQLLKS